MNSARFFIRLSRPLFLIGSALLYALGAGIARYLGVSIDWSVYIVGQAWVWLLQLGTQFLNEYFDAPIDQDNPNRTPFTGGSGMLGPGRLPRRTALFAGLSCIAVLASLTVLMISNPRITPLAFLVMGLGFLGAFFYSVPPLRLEDSGYGELTTSFTVAFLVPAFAFILQSGEMHRLVAMCTFALTVLHLAMLLAFELPDYANDLRHAKRTLLVRLGWQNGIVLHNLLILSSYLVLALAASLGMPLFVALPAFIPLPLGLLQIWLIHRIAAGEKPNWSALTLNAVALFTATTYLITFAFWTH